MLSMLVMTTTACSAQSIESVFCMVGWEAQPCHALQELPRQWTQGGTVILGETGGVGEGRGGLCEGMGQGAKGQTWMLVIAVTVGDVSGSHCQHR